MGQCEGAPPFVAFDLETTGLSTDQDRIVQFGAVRRRKWVVDGVERTEALTMLVTLDPERPISPGATKAHGITDVMVAGKPKFGDVCPQILEFIAGADLAGYNHVGFDLPMLAAELGRCGHSLVLDGRIIVDALLVFRAREPQVKHRLPDAVKFYLHEDAVGMHNAMVDAQYTLRVVAAQSDRYQAGRAQLAAIAATTTSPAARSRPPLVGRTVDGYHCLGFGKFKGVALHQVDPGYLSWVLRQGGMSSEVLDVVRAELRRVS